MLPDVSITQRLAAAQLGAPSPQHQTARVRLGHWPHAWLLGVVAALLCANVNAQTRAPTAQPTNTVPTDPGAAQQASAQTDEAEHAAQLGNHREQSSIPANHHSKPADSKPADSNSADTNPPDAGDPDLRLRYVIDDIRVVGNTRTSEGVIRRYIPFKPKDILDVDDPAVQRTRYRLLGTGFFKDVTLSLERGRRRGHVVLVVTVVERNTLVLNDLWMGLAASADTNGEQRLLSTFGGVDGAETNLFGTGMTLGTATAFSENQWALSVRFIDPGFSTSPWMLSSEFLYNNGLGFFGNANVRWDDPEQVSQVPRQAVVHFDRMGTILGVGRDLSIATQLWLTYRIEGVSAQLPNAASHEYGGELEPIDFHALPGRSLISALQASLTHDTRDQPLLTNEGWLATASTQVSDLSLGSDYSYQKVDLRAAHWWALPNSHVVKVSGFLGVIAGDAPFFERYYIGDLSDFRPGRVLGLAFDDRPAPNFLRTAIAEIRYGDYAAKLDSEYRIPLYRGHRSVFGIDLFGSIGVIGLGDRRALMRPPANLSGAARIPIDLTAGLGFRMDTSLGGFAFSFSNVLGFIPTGGDP